MPSSTCCACQSATLIHRQNLHVLANLAGVLDVLLRHYSAHQKHLPSDPTPWVHLGNLLAMQPNAETIQRDGLQQGLALASRINRNWLGEFGSLCLSCGLMFLEEGAP